MSNNWIKEYLNSHPNFPIQGVTFITFNNLLANPEKLEKLMESFSKVKNAVEANCIAAIDSRGFIFGAPLALVTKTKLCLIRKSGKTPNPITTQAKEMEYAKVSLEMAKGSLNKSDKVLIVDDIIATGATLEMSVELIEKQGASVVGITALADLCYVPKSVDLSRHNLNPLLSLDNLNDIPQSK